MDWTGGRSQAELEAWFALARRDQAKRQLANWRPWPELGRRLWLHLLRNMIVKAVIRTGAGYFSRGDGFFLIGSGSTGADLRLTTHQRIALALEGLEALEQGFDFDRL